MIVKELKELLSTVPDGLTEEQFDNLTVMVCPDGEHFHIPEKDMSGFLEFGEPCDSDGNPVSDGVELNVFGIVANTQLVDVYAEESDDKIATVDKKNFN